MQMQQIQHDPQVQVLVDRFNSAFSRLKVSTSENPYSGFMAEPDPEGDGIIRIFDDHDSIALNEFSSGMAIAILEEIDPARILVGDGADFGMIAEAIWAIVFSRMKKFEGIKDAFDSFMSDMDVFHEAVYDATHSSLAGGNGFSVELLPGGSWRVLPTNQIGNLYDSPGIILSIPRLCEDCWDQDPSMCLYDGADEAMQDSFESWVAETQQWLVYGVYNGVRDSRESRQVGV